MVGVVNILHMSSGFGETSYANNSFLQETVMQKVMPVLKHTIKGFANHDVVFSQCFKVADLGCSSSKNTLSVATNIIDIVIEVYKENYRKPPQFQIYLNDLFGYWTDFYAKLEKEGKSLGRCFLSAVPGSFYGRLFPDQSLHLIHSSYSLHWLSQVPEGLESNALNIYMAKTSPLNVLQAYGKQYYTDFTKFLHMRSKEIVRGGCMILTFLDRSMSDPTSDDCCALWELLAQSLLDMLKEGLVQESDINSFNVPTYTPCEDEVRNVIESEGSFSLDSLKIFKVNWDPHDTDYTSKNDNEPNHNHGENTAKLVRAVTEPLLTSHFGSSIIDRVFTKYAKHVAEHLAKKKTRHINIVISLTKK
ncbi:salicylic acid carboxyl methyltransferase [Artemisia annua]|uniref:Salicylic acid carboxyl methyltransferase n=1 Tax=Artemisia annua TaxID=35608 RepID=A0A2U1NLL2_ARTAN|nr:salicylic acid carboxyl methyltransferase [Artemisia annua]